MNCRVCGKEFIKKANTQCCSTKCSQILAKKTKAKCRPKPKLVMCKMCLKEFLKTSNSMCCSEKCRLKNKRQSRRRSWHKKPPDRYTQWLKLRLWRIRQRKLNEVQHTGTL